MFYHFKDKHRLSEVKLEFKGQNYMFNSYEMELYSAPSHEAARGVCSYNCLLPSPHRDRYLEQLRPGPADLHLLLGR